MATVQIERVSLRRGDVVVLDDVSLDVADGELVVILGPSGSGKTALLRVVAGLEKPDEGTVRIHGVDVTEIDTAQRRIAMVFQENALIPFLNVRRNVSFPLDIRKTPAEEIDARVTAETRVLAIEHLLSRMPGQLSAGHQQLVQAARALVRVPDVFLMDEPLARLDAHLRVMMRKELRLLQGGYGVTTLYVTNDPEEAMAMADRLVVVDAGRIAQIGPPLQVFRRPASMRVAMVVADPPMKFVPGRVVADTPGFWIEMGPIRIRAWDPALASAVDTDVEIGLLPDEVVPDPAGVAGNVVETQYLGSSAVSHVELAPGVLVPIRTDAPLPLGSEALVRVVAAHVFARSTGAALAHIDSAVS